MWDNKHGIYLGTYQVCCVDVCVVQFITITTISVKNKSAADDYFSKSWVFYGAVVQLVRTPACHAGGRGFESLLHRLFMEC